MYSLIMVIIQKRTFQRLQRSERNPMVQYLLIAYEREGFGELTDVHLSNDCIYPLPLQTVPLKVSFLLSICENALIAVRQLQLPLQLTLFDIKL